MGAASPKCAVGCCNRDSEAQGDVLGAEVFADYTESGDALAKQKNVDLERECTQMSSNPDKFENTDEDGPVPPPDKSDAASDKDKREDGKDEHYSTVQPGVEFRVELRKPGRLGLDVFFGDAETAETRDNLTVQNILEGLVWDWNEANPESKVMIGDHIIEINGVRADIQEMVNRARDDDVINMVIRRLPETQQNGEKGDLGSTAPNGNGAKPQASTLKKRSSQPGAE